MLAKHPGTVGSPSVGFLGVQLEALDNTLRSELNYSGKGVAVVGVIGGSPADTALLEPGNVIQTVDGKSRYISERRLVDRAQTYSGKDGGIAGLNNGTRRLVAVHVGTQPDQSG
jgi:S1-C subfamily serine protease